MAITYKFFNQGYKVPDVDYGSIVYENNDVLVFVSVDILNDKNITTIFTMSNSGDLLRKSIASKAVRVYETTEEIIH